MLHPLACCTPLPGLAELQSAAGALQLRHFKAGDLIYDEGDEGNDCWVIESGVCVSSQLIPGITIPGTWRPSNPNPTAHPSLNPNPNPKPNPNPNPNPTPHPHLSPYP